MTWKNDRQRHSLASRGIQTKYDCCNIKSEFSNKELENIIRDYYKFCTPEEMADFDNDCAMGSVKVHKILYADSEFNSEFIFKGTVAGVTDTYHFWVNYFPGSCNKTVYTKNNRYDYSNRRRAFI
jgi:hypothetical protein